jgi:hypothetical protein
MHPTIVQALGQARLAELRHQAQGMPWPAPPARPAPPGGSSPGIAHRGSSPSSPPGLAAPGRA